MAFAYTPGAAGAGVISAHDAVAPAAGAVMRFTRDGRHVPFDVAGTGEEGTRVPGDRISVWCARCGKPVVLPSSMSLGEVVELLEAGRRFRHPRCVREEPGRAAESA